LIQKVIQTPFTYFYTHPLDGVTVQ